MYNPEPVYDMCTTKTDPRLQILHTFLVLHNRREMPPGKFIYLSAIRNQRACCVPLKRLIKGHFIYVGAPLGNLATGSVFTSFPLFRCAIWSQHSLVLSHDAQAARHQ